MPTRNLHRPAHYDLLLLLALALVIAVVGGMHAGAVRLEGQEHGVRARMELHDRDGTLSTTWNHREERVNVRMEPAIGSGKHYRLTIVSDGHHLKAGSTFDLSTDPTDPLKHRLLCAMEKCSRASLPCTWMVETE